ncbi:Vacuolar protein sorting-associated protein 33A [Blattella germanica]|nr:Vacuolar protein sorting-associated protein 33A [Blattella germanica]
MANHLSGGKVNVAQVQELARKEFLQLLGKCDGSKAIVWDESLAGPVGLVAKYSLLKKTEVMMMFPLRGGKLPPADVRNIIFITRPQLHLMDLVADNVYGIVECLEISPSLKSLPATFFHLTVTSCQWSWSQLLSEEQSGGYRKEFHLFFVPRKSLLCEKWLKEYYLENDPTCLYQAAQAIMTLQSLFGVIPRVSGKGQAAKQVWDLMCRLARERQQGSERPGHSPQSQIDHLLLLDRALSRKARLISSQFEERHAEKTVQEIKQFIAKLPHMMAMKASLATHTTIAELIKEVTDTNNFLESLQLEQEFMNGIDTDKVHPYIEDCIAQKEPLIKILRLICMQSVTNSGLKPKVLEHYKREIIQTYGFQHVLSLSNLENAGLLKIQQGSRQYTVLRKTLRLTVEDGSEIAPTDISYVHSVYAPISVRLAQHLVRPNGWKGIQDVLGLLPGPTVEETQQLPAGHGRRGSISSQSSQNDTPRVVLVFFLGGCTFAEVSALRFLSQQEDCK